MVHDNDSLGIYDEASDDVVYFNKTILEVMSDLQSSKRKIDNEYNYDEELELNNGTDIDSKYVEDEWIFDPNNSIFKKKSQNNPFFRLFFKIPHFKEMSPDEFAVALKFREVASIGLISPSSVVNSIGVCVIIYKWGVNWIDTYVCFIFFYKKTLYILDKSQNWTNSY